MTRLSFFVASLFWLSSSAVAATPLVIPRCGVSDASFREFLLKFESNPSFRDGRIVFPLVVREGNGVTAQATIALWSRSDVRGLKDPLIYSRPELTKANLSEQVLSLSSASAEVVQSNAGEADDTRLHYRFKNFQGCWALEEFDDLGE